MAIATIDRSWIDSEFSKGIAAEHAMATEARARAENPPDPSMSVLYSQIAADDERHGDIVETIATRYGHTPNRGRPGGFGETLSRIKEKVAEIGTDSLHRVAEDLNSKANTLHWSAAWVHVFEEIGDTESARELASMLAEDRAHLDALQKSFNRMLVHRLREEPAE
jgi:hypothetical protein